MKFEIYRCDLCGKQSSLHFHIQLNGANHMGLSDQAADLCSECFLKIYKTFEDMEDPVIKSCKKQQKFTYEC